MGLLPMLQNPTDRLLLAVGISQGSTPGSVLIVVSINSLENEMEHTLHNFKDVNILGCNIQMLESRATIQRHLCRPISIKYFSE